MKCHRSSSNLDSASEIEHPAIRITVTVHLIHLIPLGAPQCTRNAGIAKADPRTDLIDSDLANGLD